jgi:hypothetical protein
MALNNTGLNNQGILKGTNGKTEKNLKPNENGSTTNQRNSKTAGKWMELEIFMLSEIRQIEKDKNPLYVESRPKLK